MATRQLRQTTRAVPLAAWLVAALLLVSSAQISGAAEPDPGQTRRGALALAQERLDAARGFATTVAERMSAAQTEQARLEAEIADAEREIPELKARADVLRAMVRERAVRLYVGRATPDLDAVLRTSNVVDAARAAHLTEKIAEHDHSVAAELQGTARALELRQVRLRAQRAELERTVQSLVPLRDLLDKRLERATSAYRAVQATLERRGAQPDAASGASLCPVQGLVVFTDDFGEPREGLQVHEGIDMPALEGTPVVAVVGGIVLHDESENGGHGAWLHGTDDVAYYYAHFSRYEGPDRIVAAGDVIGYVGSTGRSTGPHLHFEVRPQQGAAVDGFPLLLGLCAEETVTLRG